jgi:DNA-binding SARP family transcriptional activator/tetratricopeptide (TPR) repeat protein
MVRLHPLGPFAQDCDAVHAVLTRPTYARCVTGAVERGAPIGPTRDLRIHVLGEVGVEGVDRTALGSRKARQLLLALALARGKPVSTDTIAETLWRDELPRDPAAQVAVLVSRLRGAVGAEHITHGDSGYTLHYEWLDVEAAERLTGEADRRLSQGRYAGALSAARGALALLTPATAYGTADSLAERLTARARHLCSRAMLASGDHSGAVEIGQQALDSDPLDEEALRVVMAGMAAGSRSPAALLRYEAFRERLSDELGVGPSPATDAVHRAVLRGEPVPDIVVGSRSDADGLPDGSSAPVGRATEIAALDDAWRAAQTLGVTRVLVAGEPGIGKTFLVRGWIRELGPETPVFNVRCDEVNPSLPLQPVLDALHGRLREVGTDRIAELLGAEQRLLAPLFGTPVETGDGSFDVALSLASSTAGTAILNVALISLMRRLCSVPAVLFIDDVHRIDSASASWLAQLATRTPETKLLVVATQRTTERRTIAVDRVVDVGPLSIDAVVSIVGAERAAGLYDRTGGNALFLTELANAEPGVTIPATVQASIMARCEGATDVADTLRGAAVLGTSVDVELLARVLRMDPIRVIDHLEQGERLALLEERQANFVFRHEIVRDAMAASAGGLRRAWLHREAALCLETSVESDPLMVAEHARLSGERHIAARALARAALVAATRFDHAAARTLIDDSLAFEVTTEALLQRARLGLWQGRYAEAEVDAAAALERDDDPRALEVAGAIAYYRRQFAHSRDLADMLPSRTDDPRLRLGGLIIGARASHAAGDLSTALQLIERATDVAQRFRLVKPNSVHAFIQVHRGDIESALRLTDAAAGLGDIEPSSTAYTSVHEHFIGGYALATCGRVAEALGRWEQGSREAHRQGFVRYMSLCTNLSSWVYRGIGELSRARESNHEAREGGRAADYRELEAFAVLDLCETDLIEGDIAGAADILAEADAMVTEDYAYRWRHLLRIGVVQARIALASGEAERAQVIAAGVRMRAHEHAALRYERLAALVEIEATTVATGSVDPEHLLRVCRDLPGVAGPEAWALVGHAAAVTGVEACATLAVTFAANLATALPEDLAETFGRYARTQLDMMRMSGRRG